MTLKPRDWVASITDDFVQEMAARTLAEDSGGIANRIEALAKRNQQIHRDECFNLDPASNVMNPRAEALLASGLGSSPSLGYPKDKYENGLEAIEEIEAMTAALAAEVFQADYAEIRVPSGAIANLYAFMATCKSGDTIIAPPPSIGGHVTHHAAGCAGLYGLKIHDAPINADGYTVDVDALRDLAKKVKPKLITIGGSLNLFAHPVREVREIADEVGAKVLFDAAHQCGIIAGGVFANPLAEGAHLMTFSTYKSLGGPAGGLIVSNDAEMAERIEAIAFPGMTANFDAAKSAALEITLLDWRDHGRAYAQKMVSVAQAFATALSAEGLPVFAADKGYTSSHQFAIEAAGLNGGQTAARKLRKAGFLACGIGLPIDAVEGDMNGLRIGTPEIVRWGVTEADVPEIAALLARALKSNTPDDMAHEVANLRVNFNDLHYINP